jgi:ubiquinone/menaquinone biosynthesis C-methylase UbiE
MTERGAVDYDATAWAAGPQRVYDRLAERAVALLPTDLSGRRALDAGAGTGALTRAFLRRGARVDAADVSTKMVIELALQTQGQVATTVADVRALPIRSASYDVTGSAFVLNHLLEPHLAVAELARVTQPDGYVLATSFAEHDPPVKLAIEEVLRRHGYQPPSWYVEMKATTMPLTATVQAFESVAERAGLENFHVAEVVVDFDDLEPAAVATYRLGMAHTAPFLAELPTAARRGLTADAIAAVASAPPLSLVVLGLVAGALGPRRGEVDRAHTGSGQSDAADVGSV